LGGDPRFWAKNEGKTVDYECDGVGNRRFWAKNGGWDLETYTNIQKYDEMLRKSAKGL